MIKRKKGGGRKQFDGKIGKKKTARIILENFPTGVDTDTIVSRLGISRSSYYRFINSYLPLKTEIERYRKQPQLKRARELWNSPLGQIYHLKSKPFYIGIAAWIRYND